MALLTHGQTMSSSAVTKVAEFLLCILALLLFLFLFSPKALKERSTEACLIQAVARLPPRK